MAVRTLCVLGAAIGLGVLFGLSVRAEELSFEERVRAQEAIERVYHAHRVGETRTFEEAVPREILEEKVRDSLDRSAALEYFWNHPVTAEALARETERIQRGSKMPRRLGELCEALGNDAFLVQECLARPTLVRRLTRRLFAADERIHGGSLADRRTWDEWWEESRSRFAGDRVDAVASSSAPLSRAASNGVCEAGPDDEWKSGLLGLAETERATAVWTGSEMIVWGGSLEDDVLGTGARYDPLIDAWSVVSTTGAPDSRAGHTAVWTGSEMIVWGGTNAGVAFGDGARYDPPTDTWTPVTQVGAPDPRANHTAVWTGSEMIVWGGYASGHTDSGGRYDPAGDSWSVVSEPGAPAARTHHTAVWTGSEMIVWGGHAGATYHTTGGRYDPVQDSWEATPTSGVPPGRVFHTAVWTGTEMIVYGGEGTGGSPRKDGSRYDPAAGSWTQTSGTDAWLKAGHAAVWSGQEMIVFGGNNTNAARYDPAEDDWVALPSVSFAIPTDLRSAAVWTGEEMIVWHHGDSARYDPSSNTWSASIHPVPLRAKFAHTAVWTGAEMIVWGGADDDGPPVGFRSGGRYDPALDTWEATSLSGTPSGRWAHSAVWTGSEMIVWGGYATGNVAAADGGRYDPVTNGWTPVSTIDAPSPRGDHGAVWTGGEMIVWGGNNSGGLDTGGRYDPLLDSWTPMSTAGAPAGRRYHTTVWTGSEMIVWGGGVAGTEYDSGGRYDPVADSWTPTSLIDAPPPASRQSGVWTDAEMVVFGDGSAGSYRPTDDSWHSLVGSATYSSYTNAVAVWTGQHVITWGGVLNVNQGGWDFGFRFEPDGAPFIMSMEDAPPRRYQHTAVWTGEAIIVWGGWFHFSVPPLRSGGIYYSAVDADGDGVVNECDCAPDDAQVFDSPAEIVNVRWNDAETVAWDSDAPNSGEGTGYDVVRGDLDALPVGGVGETCVAPDAGETNVADTTLPGSGAGFYYLVRGANVCGSGTYGENSAGAPRTSSACS